LNRVDWELKCRGIGPQSETFNILTASMILLIAVFIIAIVVLSCVSLSYRKQLKELKDPERRRLLPDYPDSVNAYA
uniref:G_PROTEIN_RECEP_F1_2 domain-containing protein n=1 Tax=Angiostrongylus cantonensis TaxID=6313 RepID=A0A0K0DNN0_ANGCA